LKMVSLSGMMRISVKLLAGLLVIVALGRAQEFRPEIPKVWDDEAVAGFELPLAQRDRSPRHLSSSEYYALKVRPIYKTYPMYEPGKEPAGYIEWLKQQEPEIVFDPAKLKTKEDWIAAGKLVFESEVQLHPLPPGVPPVNGAIPASKEGILQPFRDFNRYIIRKKGVLEIGENSCASCHTRVMPDGSYLPGAQGGGGLEDPQKVRAEVRELTPEALAQRRESFWILWGAPWVESKEEFSKRMSLDELVRVGIGEHPGVVSRQGTSGTHPPHVPSLIGLKDRKYLDSTGFVRHRSIGDLARYAVTNQGLDTLAHYGDFQPSLEVTAFSSDKGTRYSDEQLYALALYIYSLEPPKNPNPVDDLAKRGQKVFSEQGCAGCHTPPLYTNNKLTPAKGFNVPTDLRQTDDILDVSVGTDPTLALKTRRGTGFYKVPSLRGVWYRNAFGHGGWVDTLEEWFDPARVKSDYVAKGYWMRPGPIEGHEFGLQLSVDDRKALIAFLKTL
jgi:mono/diheme cytochrome c family protein